MPDDWLLNKIFCGKIDNENQGGQKKHYKKKKKKKTLKIFKMPRMLFKNMMWLHWKESFAL